MLITGADGFIGSKLTHYLHAKGIAVSQNSILQGDISVADLRILYGTDIDHVVHLAARTYVPDSWKYPREYYQTNTMGTLSALEFCRKCNCPFTYLNTYVYGVPQYLPIDEKHPVCPNTPYNHSKYLGEEIAQFYSENMSVPVTVLRLFNVYGPCQDSKFLIPEVISQAIDPSVKKIVVQDLRPRRDYVYIDDLLRAIHQTITSTVSRYEVVNIGSGKSWSVGEIVELIQQSAGTDKPVSCTGVQRKNEVPDIVADIRKAQSLLNYFPRVDFIHGIKKTVKYMKGEMYEEH
ncbi:MAG: NAD-dependent epimerase/dehydratase family protein [Suipraeoptans sp.]